MTALCPHDLTAVSCATCAGLAPTPAPSAPSRPFTARYNGTCAGCGFDIRKGERCVKVDGRTVHDAEVCR